MMQLRRSGERDSKNAGRKKARSSRRSGRRSLGLECTRRRLRCSRTGGTAASPPSCERSTCTVRSARRASPQSSAAVGMTGPLPTIRGKAPVPLRAKRCSNSNRSVSCRRRRRRAGRSAPRAANSSIPSLTRSSWNSRRRIRNSPSMQEAPDGMAMDDDELEAIRRKKLAELQQIQGQAAAEQQYREQVQAQRQTILRQILTPEARERLGRIELAYPELKENIENQLIQLAQSGRVQRQIDDPTLRQILERVIPKRRDIKIERR